MKRISISILCLVFLVSFTHRDKMVGKKMPAITGITISGKVIDTAYFNNKVTLITFMYIGCPGCMYEISVLNQINQKYQGKDFQILCIAPHTPKQVNEFNSSDTIATYGMLRHYFKADLPSYDILPECDKEKPRTKKEIKDRDVMPECEHISKLFKVDGFPQSYLINKKGIIVKHYEGYLEQDDSTTVRELSSDIDKFLTYSNYNFPLYRGQLRS